MAANLNTFVHESTATNCFITFFFCELNTSTGDLAYVNSGHNPPIILDKKKKLRRLETCGLCLGMLPDQDYEVKKTSLNPGDTAILYTDGFTEIRNKSSIELQEEGLIKMLKKHVNLSAEELMGEICSDVDSFAEGANHMDDMTLVVIKRIR
jgi:sigma-B regulation protein RsbU (phosphoserine phosphatase)